VGYADWTDAELEAFIERLEKRNGRITSVEAYDLARAKDERECRSKGTTVKQRNGDLISQTKAVVLTLFAFLMALSLIGRLFDYLGSR